MINVNLFLSLFHVTSPGLKSHGECTCPPGTVQVNATSPCYKIFDRGPCKIGSFVQPLEAPKSTVKKTLRLGECRKMKFCAGGKVYVPEKDTCYELMTRGPCSSGKLLALDANFIPKCQCSEMGELANYYHRETRTCHQFYTQGKCSHGKLFLPSKTCGCDKNLPHYHNKTNQCYELSTVGPCPNYGFEFVQTHQDDAAAQCQCKSNYVQMPDGLCYRKWTRGPCDETEVVSDNRTCITSPCQKNFLYFPQQQTCYRIGTQGPCKFEEVVVFDFTVKLSADGPSVNGMCGCSGIIKNLDRHCSPSTSTKEKRDEPKMLCEKPLVDYRGKCYQLYSQGPCATGQWLEPNRNHMSSKAAKCQCMPGHVPYDNNATNSDDDISGCHPPTVILARFLNGNRKIYKFAFPKQSSRVAH